MCDAHRAWGQAFAARATRLPPVARAPDPRRRPLRVGYVSPDLFTHSVSYFAEAPLTLFRPEEVSVFVYDATQRPDARSAHLQERAARAGAVWRPVAALSEDALADAVRADEIDILVELSGHTAFNRLGCLAKKPAPIQARQVSRTQCLASNARGRKVRARAFSHIPRLSASPRLPLPPTQVTWIGYPNSTGLQEVDYRFTDALCDPPDTAQTFVEKLVRLPRCFLAYSTPATPQPPPVSPAPSARNGFVTFGSFNNLAKVTPAVRALWAQLLKAVPTARLVVKAKPFACQAARLTFPLQPPTSAPVFPCALIICLP